MRGCGRWPSTSPSCASLHDQVRELDDDGKYPDAVFLSVGHEQPERARPTGRGATKPAELARRRPRCRRRCRATSRARRSASCRRPHDARIGFGVLVIAIPLFAILAGLLVLLGLERRIGEYR